MTYNFRTQGVVIHNAYDANLLEDLIQAQRYVLSILKLNQDEEIAPGDLAGISLMLKNAERVLADACTAHPALKRDPVQSSQPAPLPQLAKAV